MNKVYTADQETAIEKEFARLKGNYYLDHAGATLYSEKQLESIMEDFSSNIFSNPHARNSSSKATEDAIDIVRYRILEHFNTTVEKYSVIFTSNATAALRTIAECFNYGEEIDGKTGIFAYLEDNHTSVLGMRTLAKKSSAIKKEEAFKVLTGTTKRSRDGGGGSGGDGGGKKSNSLFVFPAQSNFSGTKYPLSWIRAVKNAALDNLLHIDPTNWYVVLDCASYASTNVLDLSKHQPDFIPISFYKMFGYPTGVGALLVKKSSEHILEKKYFGGGTVSMVLAKEPVAVPRDNMHERFEDGTVPFLSIIAIRHGFDTLKRLNLNFDLISKHTFSLARYAYERLVTLHHYNDRPVAVLYHDTNFQNRHHQGAIVNFNLLRPNGNHVGYSELLHMANLHGIHLRTGCSCNPGACQSFLKLTSEQVRKHFEAGHVCGDQLDLVDGRPTGSVRISFGYMSTESDANRLLQMIEDCFAAKPIKRKLPDGWRQNNVQNDYDKLFGTRWKQDGFEIMKRNDTIDRWCLTSSPSCTQTQTRGVVVVVKGLLERIFIYPVKSCRAFSVENWQIGETGFHYDRRWMIVDSNGVPVTQKHNKKLCLLQPVIDLQNDRLRLEFHSSSIEVPLVPQVHEKTNTRASVCQSKVCGDKINARDCGDQVANWLCANLGKPGLRLLRLCDVSEENTGRTSSSTIGGGAALSLANKAQFLLINTATVRWLRKTLSEMEFEEDFECTIDRFRPNLVVNFDEAFVENECEQFRIGDTLFEFAGKCNRCQMICINQKTGETSKEPLLTLAREFAGKITFGVYLNKENQPQDAIASASIRTGTLLTASLAEKQI